jgi:hypothetical protein
VAGEAASEVMRGTFYYVSTVFNKRRFVESLPGAATVCLIVTGQASKVTVTPQAVGNIYRSSRASSIDFVSGDLTHFYFVGDTQNGTTGVDLRGDKEIQRGGRLNCRGGRPKACRYMILNQGRAWYAGFDYSSSGSYFGALYFDARCVEWSSAGRVEEVARQYSLTARSVPLYQLPELTPGYFGEARMFLPDEVGGGVTGLAGIGNEVLAFTTRQTMSISGGVEPFAQRVISRDVGPRILRLGFIGERNLFAEIAGQQGGMNEDEWMIRGGHRLWIAPEEKPKTYELDNAPVEARAIPGAMAVPLGWAMAIPWATAVPLGWEMAIPLGWATATPYA